MEFAHQRACLSESVLIREHVYHRVVSSEHAHKKYQHQRVLTNIRDHAYKVLQSELLNTLSFFLKASLILRLIRTRNGSKSSNNT